MSAVAFRPKGGRRQITLSVTPLIDVLFLLIIFFMLTGTFKRVGELELALPDSSTSAPQSGEADDAQIELIATEGGDLTLDGEPVDRETLLRTLSSLHAADPDRRVLINAEAEVRHGEIVFLLDQVRESGFAGAAIGTHVSGAAPLTKD